MTWHYRAETKGIQSWLFNTSKLRDIKGGSHVIASLRNDAKALEGALGIPEDHVIQRAAGAVWYRFETKDAMQRFASEWLAKVQDRAPGIQVVHAWSDAPDPREALVESLRARRNAPPASLPEAGPWLARSGRSGLPSLILPEEDKRRSPHHRLQWDAAQYAKERANRAANREMDRIADVDLGLDDAKEGLLAVVHADGTGIGRLFLGRPLGELKSISEKLERASNAALEAAVKQVAGGASALELQVVVRGGDDLTIICAAELALAFTRTWLAAFEAETEAHLGERLRAGAGIAITARRYPFRRAYALAESLCDHAKRPSKDADGNPIDSVLALRRITTSFDDDDLEGQGVWQLGHTPKAPSRLPAIAALDALQKATGALPRGGLRTWLTAFEAAPQSEGTSKLWQRMREIHGERFGDLLRALRDCAADDQGRSLESSVHPPQTPIRDALTLNVIDRRGGPRGR